MKRVCFRFDIDTHKCIRDGVPALLDISNQFHVPFTFFLNLGKAVSFFDSFREMFREKPAEPEVQALSARTKLGNGDYLFAAFINPENAGYEKEIKRLLKDPLCETGIHGGRNHAVWQFYAGEWDEARIKREVEWSIGKIQGIDPDYELCGFASPTFLHPKSLSRILKDLGFCYTADAHGRDIPVYSSTEVLPDLGINLLGEPGGVAFWESCIARGFDQEEIRACFIRALELNETIVVYDHPYFAGTKCRESLVEIIQYLKKEKIEIVPLRKLLEE